MIEWGEMIRRLKKLYDESKAAIDEVPNRHTNKSRFASSTKKNFISPVLTVKKVVTPSKKLSKNQPQFFKTPGTGAAKLNRGSDYHVGNKQSNVHK